MSFIFDINTCVIYIRHILKLLVERGIHMSQLNEKLLNWITNISTEKDERERTLLNQKLATTFIITYIGMPILLLSNLIIDAYHQTISLNTILLFIFFFIINGVLLYKTKSDELNKDKVYSPEEYKKLVNKYRIKSVILMLYFGSAMFLLGLIIKYLQHTSIQWGMEIITAIIAGIVFGGFMYVYQVNKIMKEY